MSNFKVGDKVRVVKGNYFERYKGRVGEVIETYFDYDSGMALVNIGGTEMNMLCKNLGVIESKPEVGDTLTYEQVKRGQKIRVSIQSKTGITNIREGIVGSVARSTQIDTLVNWTIYVLDEQKERWNEKGARLNWGSLSNDETIVLLEEPKVDLVLEKLLESPGGTVVRGNGGVFFERSAFSDEWKSPSGGGATYTAEKLRAWLGPVVTFYKTDND